MLAYYRGLARTLHRRIRWFTREITASRIRHMALASLNYMSGKQLVTNLPIAVKIDISPLCNLHCTVCVHAHPAGRKPLERQRFDASQRMSVEGFSRIINEIRGAAGAVSLYYLGDPLMHPKHDELCRIAADAGLNVHSNTNFSFPLSDARIERIVVSGLTHLTVCVDGMSQENYQKTRVGGRLDWVLDNLRRVCAARRRLDARHLEVEVQYIKYRHNMHEIDEARNAFSDLGVDRFATLNGCLGNYTDRNPGTYRVREPLSRSTMPRCLWPWFSSVIKYNGDVIPCCGYRVGLQYAEEGDMRVLGNVFSDGGLRAVWNSQAYRDLRLLAANPASCRSTERLRRSFCYGCGLLFDDDCPPHPLGSTHDFEDLYRLGEDGIPIPIQSDQPRGHAVLAGKTSAC